MPTLSKSLIFPFLLVAYEIVTYLSNDMYLPALPAMMRDLGLTTHQAQFTLTAWFFGAACMPLIVGALTDRFGRRSILLIGGAIYTTATIVCALTANPFILLAARFIEGGMVPFMMVPGYACIHESYEQAQAIRLLALMGSISVLAPALGPLFGSAVLLVWNWRGIFWVIAALALVTLTLLARFMPETLPPEKRHSLQIGVLAHNYWQILTNKQFMLLMGVLGLTFSGWITWITASPLLVIETFHYSATIFGLVQALVFGVYILANRFVKVLLEKLGVHPLVRLGFRLTCAGTLLVLLSAWLMPATFWLLLSAMLVYSFGSALCYSPLNRLIIEASPQPMGARMAMFSVFLSGFGTLGSAFSGMFFDGSMISLALIMSGCIAMAAIIKSWATN